MSDVFIVHPSVFHDAFRRDYVTPYRDSSKDFLNLLKNHFVKTNKKVAFTSGETFKKLCDSSMGKTKTLWIIPEYLVTIDFETYFNPNVNLNVDQSIIKLASKLCIRNTPFIVSTHTIKLEDTNFTIVTPGEAIKLYAHPNSRFC